MHVETPGMLLCQLLREDCFDDMMAQSSDVAPLGHLPDIQSW